MDYTLLAVIVGFAAIVVGVAAYKRNKKKARLLQAQLDANTAPTTTPTASADTQK